MPEQHDEKATPFGGSDHHVLPINASHCVLRGSGFRVRRFDRYAARRLVGGALGCPRSSNLEDYLAILGQLPKLRMSFLGLHTYPEDRPNAEPTVWIGLPGDIGQAGRVGFSYPSSYQNTLRGKWGYARKPTSEYVFGTAALFERDAFGPDVMGASLPAPSSPEANNEVSDRAAALLRQVFAFAHQLGVKTCVGTETPLIVPKLVQARIQAQGKNPSDLAVLRDLYAGIFSHAAAAHPLDYFWFWTPEGWTWPGVKDQEIAATTNDFFAAIAAHQQLRSPFSLATCGWVLGPPQDRALFDKMLPKSVAVSCINPRLRACQRSGGGFSKQPYLGHRRPSPLRNRPIQPLRCLPARVMTSSITWPSSPLSAGQCIIPRPRPGSTKPSWCAGVEGARKKATFFEFVERIGVSCAY